MLGATKAPHLAGPLTENVLGDDEIDHPVLDGWLVVEKAGWSAGR